MTTQASCPDERLVPHARLGFLRRGLISALLGLAFGGAIAVLNGQALPKTLVYSLLISLSCWLCIDGGRSLSGRALYRLRGGAAPNDNPRWPGWPGMAVVVLAGSALGYSGGNALGDWLYGYVPQYPLLTGDLPHRLGQLLLAVLPATALTYFMYTRATLADERAAAQAAQRQAAESRLKLLESQLEPHMLFNTLANLRALISVDPPRAQVMLDQLIGFLRSTLSGSRLERHALSAEFGRLADYLALMQVRMAERLEARFELPEELAALPVPPLLLQPLVENSIRHGLEPSVKGGRIVVSARRVGEELVLCVRDTGIGYGGAAVAGTSFGLAQVRERLLTLYGARATLEVVRASDEAGGTIATLKLPLGAA
jgi:hypothetical protein